MKRILLLLILILTLCMFKEYEGYNEDMTIDEKVDKNKDDISELNSNQVKANQQNILENTSTINELKDEISDLIKRTKMNEDNTNENRTKIDDTIMPVVNELEELKTKAKDKEKLDSQ